MGWNHKDTKTQRKAASVILICGLCLCLCVFVVPTATAQDASARIKAAQYALGMIRGPQRIDAINTVEYWGTGVNYTYHVSLSYLTPAMRVEITNYTPNARRIQVVNNNFAWDESVPGAGFIPGTTATPRPEAVKERLLQLWTTPHGALKAAVRAGASAKLSTENGANVITFPLSGQLAGITMKITLNAKDQVEKVETVNGNAVTITTYSDYMDLGEIKSDVLFPLHIAQAEEDGRRVFELTISKADMNNPYVVFPVPDNVEKNQRD
jgi:hypothetical protein